MEELTLNLHIHTLYSDGHKTHAQIADLALETGVDAILTTDHNVYVSGPEGYYKKGNKRLLFLIGEEVHDQARKPQANHMLVLNAGREMAVHAPNPQRLIDQVRSVGGLSFLAHPFDPAVNFVNEGDNSWVSWDIHSFTGLEIWNSFSEIKLIAHNLAEAIFYVLFPKFIGHHANPKTLEIWDSLLKKGSKVVAIGGSDAHGTPMQRGPIKREVLPYQHHFQCINNHLLIEHALCGNLEEDKRCIYQALGSGHTYVGYDLPASTKGFRFSAKGLNCEAIMGDSIPLEKGVTLLIHLPFPVECHLLKDGKVIKIWRKREICAYAAGEPGAYRVECFI
ncbi:MAG TPA: CehA/McbA family metallohydrolase, partial [Longilinea sp.]|nr:CehA/McbA family metallohydrolase [Longilinea sp.]